MSSHRALSGLSSATRRETEDIRRVLAALEPTPWTDLTYNGNWVDYGGSFQAGQYRKIGDIVYLRGLLKNTGDANAPAVAITTLPVGFRPPASGPSIFVCDGYNNGAGTYTDARVNVAGSGVVSMEDTEQVDGTIGYLSLEGVYFSVTA